MNKNTMELLKVIGANPELPVVPMVDGEVVGDDCGVFMGALGRVTVDKFIVSRQDGVLFKSDDDVFDTLERCLTDEEFDALPETEAECRPIYEALPWRKAILLYVEPLGDER